MLYNVEKCTLNIYRSRVIYFEILVATLDLKIKLRGKNAQKKGEASERGFTQPATFFIKNTLQAIAVLAVVT